MRLFLDFLQWLEQRPRLELRARPREMGPWFSDVLRRGWLQPDGYLAHIQVPFLDGEEQVAVEIDELAGRFRYASPQRRSLRIARPLSEIALYRLSLDTWLDDLAALFGLTPFHRPRQRVKVAHHLWHLGNVRLHGTQVRAPLFLGRQLRSVPTAELANALGDPIYPGTGLVLCHQQAGLTVPAAHGLRELSAFPSDDADPAGADLVALDRILKSLVVSRDGRCDASFDPLSGVLNLPHLDQPRRFKGKQKKIIAIFWQARDGEPLTWADVARQSGSAAKSIDRAFGKDDPWADWIEHDGHGLLRLRLPPRK